MRPVRGLRRERTRGPLPVGVTGAGSGLGAALLGRLAARPDVLVVPADGPAGEGPLPEGLHAVVHLATTYDVALPAAERRARNVGGTAELLDRALAAGVRRVVLTTSADVYGHVPGRPVPLPDATPLAAGPDPQALLGDHVEVERLAQHAALTGLAVTVLRPATLVGGALGPAYDGQLLRQLSAPRLLAVRGAEPLWQLCHADDLLAALELAAVGAVTGGLGVAGAGALTQAAVEGIAGRRRLELPAAVALSTAERLHRLGVTTSSPRELDHLLAPLVLACDGLAAAGWAPAWSHEDALRAHLAARAPGPGAAAATATAAGATVALVGTAALVRARRARRRR